MGVPALQGTAGKVLLPVLLPFAHACTRSAPPAAVLRHPRAVEVEGYVAAGQQAVDEVVLAVPLAHQLHGAGKGKARANLRGPQGVGNERGNGARRAPVEGAGMLKGEGGGGRTQDVLALGRRVLQAW